MKKLLLLFLLLPFICFSLTSGPNNPSSSSTNSSVGTVAWNTISNTYTSDDLRATSNNLSNGDVTNYIIATGFGFNIPSTSVIDGIKVTVELSDDAGVGGIKDNLVYIVKGGVISGTNLSKSTAWPNADASRNYGGTSNLWGLSWSYTDINSVNFGIAISAYRASGAGTNNAKIDHIEMTISYSSTMPIELLYFGGKTAEDYNTLTWTTASESNNDFFTLFRSVNGIDFKIVGIIDGAGSTSQLHNYYLFDRNPEKGVNYYKLMQTDFDGRNESFNIIAVNFIPNADKRIVKIIDETGKEVDGNTFGVKFYIFDDGSIIKGF